MLCQTFVFCYLWAVGGNLTDDYWDAFDSFLRQQFEDNSDAKVNHTHALQLLEKYTKNTYSHSCKAKQK